MMDHTAMVTLDSFMPKPLTRRTERFMQFCEFYRSTKGKYPESPLLVYDFIHDTVLHFDLRHFKLLSQGRILSVFWKWQRIMGMARVEA
ncbi:MAG: hypothetical protein M1113_00615 [Candidatus Thermoplasmatota archaeon]|nr:hypothetical protein [Candidatus Thermoplasmatota archaeon]